MRLHRSAPRGHGSHGRIAGALLPQWTAARARRVSVRFGAALSRIKKASICFPASVERIAFSLRREFPFLYWA
jgi:hypothetical protein